MDARNYEVEVIGYRVNARDIKMSYRVKGESVMSVAGDAFYELQKDESFKTLRLEEVAVRVTESV